MADVFQRAMMAAYDERIAASMRPMFLSGFFGKNPTERIVSEVEKVDVDIIRDNRRLAVDVIRGGGQGNTNFTGQYTAKEYSPPLYWEEAPITAAMLNKRLPGVDPYTPVGKMAALIYHASRVQGEQAMKIEREMERMAAEALLSGTITLVNTDSLDFAKKATHAVVPGVKWDAASPTIIADIRSLAEVIHQDGKMKPNTAIFGTTAWNLFINDADVQTYLDNRRIEPGRINPEEIPEGATYQGRVWIGDFQLDLFTYPEFYQNAAGTAVSYVTTDSVVLMNREAYLGKAFAAVEVLPQYTDQYRDMGLPSIPQFTPGEIVPFVYEKAPSALVAGVQSAPLLIPNAIDTIGTLDNVDT